MELVTIPISGSFDASGHADISQRVQSSRFAAVTVTVKTVDQGANPTWILQIGDAPYLWGTGPNVARGPIPVRPEDQIHLVAFGGSRNDTFTGLIWGVVADSEEEIATVFQAQAQGVALQKSSDRINVTTTIVKTAASGQTITVADASQFQIADSIFLTTSPGASQQTFGGFNVTGIARNTDGTWNVTLQAALPAGGVNPGDVLTLSPTVRLDFSESGVPVNATIVNGTPTASAVINGSAFGNGVTLHLVAGATGKVIRVFDYRFIFDTAAVASPLLQSTGGSRVDAGWSTTAGGIMIQGNAGGRALPSGDGLDLVQQAANAGNCYGHVHYIQ